MPIIPRLSLICGPVFKIQALPSGQLNITVEDVELSGLPLNSDPIFTKKDLAARLKLSVRTVDNLMRHTADPIPYSVVGGSPRFRESEIQRWMDSRKSVGSKRAFARAKVV